MFLRIFIKKHNNMAKINDSHDIIVLAQSPIMSAHTYSEIYGGSAGCTAVINGTSVNVGAASSLFITIRTISGGTGCYLLGVNKDVTNGSPYLY